MTATHATPRPHADTALPPIVSAEEWSRARAELLEVEKAQTRANDAVAAKRRQLPMVEVDATLEFEGPDGTVTLLDLFDGRRQLLLYHNMLKAGESPCPGCSAFTDFLPHLSQLNVWDVTFVQEAAAPYEEFRAHVDELGRPDVPVVSTHGTGTREVLHQSPHGVGSFSLTVYVRDGERVFRTWSTQGRGVDTINLMDVTIYGRQQAFQDVPDGWPQRPTYSFGKVHTDYTDDELAGLAAPSTTGQTASDEG